MPETLWNIYRDESERDLLVKVSECMVAYRRKMGVAPNIVGVASSLSEGAQAALEQGGVRVVRNLPAWAKSEIWVGFQAPSATHVAETADDGSKPSRLAPAASEAGNGGAR